MEERKREEPKWTQKPISTIYYFISIVQISLQIRQFICVLKHFRFVNSVNSMFLAYHFSSGLIVAHNVNNANTKFCARRNFKPIGSFLFMRLQMQIGLSIQCFVGLYWNAEHNVLCVLNGQNDKI